MKNSFKDLSEISLGELHILKTHAHQTLEKLGRLMGNRMDIKTHEAQDFKYFGGIYLKLEEEMNDRIISTVIEK